MPSTWILRQVSLCPPLGNNVGKSMPAAWILRQVSLCLPLGNNVGKSMPSTWILRQVSLCRRSNIRRSATRIRLDFAYAKKYFRIKKRTESENATTRLAVLFLFKNPLTFFIFSFLKFAFSRLFSRQNLKVSVNLWLPRV